MLVVEDEYVVASELKFIMMAHGAKAVWLSGQLADAAKQLKRGDFKIALLDINIRGDRVYSLADELKRQKVPFAFLTGSVRKEIPARFADVPIWAKPLDNRLLIEDVCKLQNPAL